VSSREGLGPIFTGLLLAAVGVFYAGLGLLDLANPSYMIGLVGPSNASATVAWSDVAVGLLFLGGGVVEFACAREFRWWRQTQGTPPRGWRRGAAFVAIVAFALPLLGSAIVLVGSVLMLLLWLSGVRNFA
jgi:hypothetical protein